MTKREELYALCKNINTQLGMNEEGVHLKIKHENNLFYVRTYNGSGCENTIFGGGSIKEIESQLFAFRRGFFFVDDYKRIISRKK